jgi:hypothetical protein
LLFCCYSVSFVVLLFCFICCSLNKKCCSWYR